MVFEKPDVFLRLLLYPKQCRQEEEIIPFLQSNASLLESGILGLRRLRLIQSVSQIDYNHLFWIYQSIVSRTASWSENKGEKDSISWAFSTSATQQLSLISLTL